MNHPTAQFDIVMRKMPILDSPTHRVLNAGLAPAATKQSEVLGMITRS